MQFKTLSGPPTAGFWTLWHSSPCILAPESVNPNDHSRTGVLIFHVGLIAQFYDYDNVLQIATRQLIQWTWISGQLTVVLASFNHHVISHLFNLNTHTHARTEMWFVVWVLSTSSPSAQHIQAGCLPSPWVAWLPHCHNNSSNCWESHDLH